MEKKSRNIVGGLPPPTSSIVAVAITGSRKSKHIVKWALEKFVPQGDIYFRLLHVRPMITRIPTPMGNFIPISQVRDDVADAFRKEVEWQSAEKLLPYKKMCTKKQVEVEIIQIESDDVVTAISLEISKCKINKLVIGSSSRSLFSRARTLSSKISECCPSFCTVYAVSKGKLSSLRPSDSETNTSNTDDSSDISSSTYNSSTRTSSSRTEWTDKGSTGSYSNFRSASLPAQRFQALSTINQNLLHKRMASSGTTHSTSLYPHIEDEDDASSSYPNGSDVNDTISEASSFTSLVIDDPLRDQGSTSNVLKETSNVNFELEKLRTELRHVRGMYTMAQSEAIDASRKLNNIHKHRVEEGIKLKQISFREEEAKKLARLEREKYEAAKREADYVKECAEREAAERKDAEIRASREAKEKEKLEKALNGSLQQYKKFTWEEIVLATSSFSENLKIGMGAYGTVYKCSFHHTTAAAKILHSKEASRTNQFQQELEILSKIRHPHLLILLGACPERGCLIYEFMENGSLEDRLLRKNNTPPLPWFSRYRIAWEVASALVFLHNTKPKPIIHRDLKPANILLDRNNVSKIGDIGLSKVLHSDSSINYKDTALVGTLSYIDPEYQRTGLDSPMSDVYAFGMVILQLLTAKPPKALAHMVESVMDEDHLTEVLDPEAGEWPIEETKDLALMALRCTELRRRDRPHLQDEVLPVLEKLKEVAESARDGGHGALVSKPPPPSHFICPILKEVMRDPCVAADGYTYDRKAIEAWLEENGKSPMTNLSLPHNNLIPNYNLLSAIMEWESGKD